MLSVHQPLTALLPPTAPQSPPCFVRQVWSKSSGAWLAGTVQGVAAADGVVTVLYTSPSGSQVPLLPLTLWLLSRRA